VVTPDPRKLAAPVIAQAVSFVAVLAIGAFTAASPPSVHVAAPKTHPSASPTAAVNESELTVRATADRVPLAGLRVSVLRYGTLAGAASGVLNGADAYAARVPAGSYLVCLSVPTGLEVAGPGSTSGLPGWACSAVRAKAGPAPVTFRLVPKPTRKAPR